MHIVDVLRRKGDDVVTIAPDRTVRDLIELLGAHGVGAAVVSTDGSTVEGIVSERDVVRRLRSDGDAVLDSEVGAIMTAEVHTCEPSSTLEDLMGVMTERRIRHVPVLRDGVLAGIVSIGDVVKHRMAEVESERDQLSSYISG